MLVNLQKIPYIAPFSWRRETTSLKSDTLCDEAAVLLHGTSALSCYFLVLTNSKYEQVTLWVADKSSIIIETNNRKRKFNS